MRYPRWFIAYRENRNQPFQKIDNPNWAWAADPFLVEYSGKIFLFAELFLYGSERNGIIGYCEYNGNGFSEWTITMDKHWHLSYPNVWVENGQLYMCPETGQMEEIAIYVLESFPNKWRKTKVLKMNGHFVDTTFLDTETGRYMFTYRNKCAVEDEGLMQFVIDSEWNIESDGKMVSNDKSSARPGGNFLKEDNRVIRVAQDCSSRYGAGLVLSKVNSVWPDYSEEEIRRIYPGDISGNWDYAINGIHTYNSLHDLEVIDLRYDTQSMKETVARKRIRRVFVDKFR